MSDCLLMNMSTLLADGFSHSTRYVTIGDTVRGFSMILSGELDHVPEQMFLYAGPIDDVLARYAQQRTHADND